MGSGRNLLFPAHIVLNIVGLAISQPDFFYRHCFEGSGNYTTNSMYQKNLYTLISSLSADTDRYGFNSSSLGKNPNRVNGIVLCRGDVDLDTCHRCINNSPIKLIQECPLRKQAVGWYELCMLWYSDETISGKISTWPMLYAWNTANASSVDQFHQKLTALLDQLTSQAASGGSLRKFATGNEAGPDFQTIYGLMQCTPDLSEMNCTYCLMGIRKDMWDYIGDSIGGRVVTPSCNLRFETYPFFNDGPTDAPLGSNDGPADAPLGSNDGPVDTPPGKNDNTTRTVIIVVSTISSVTTLVVYIFLFIRKRKQMKERRRKHNFEISEGGDGISSTVESLQYDFDTIKVATDNFSYANKLGQGGFGAVYKGKLHNGQAIAVKRLSKNSGQGELEFKNEVTLVAKLQHRNLIRLLGFCLEGVERLLIYEFVTNSSLDRSIFDPVKRVFLDWERRYKIIIGIARGVLYLHEDSRLRIIHRDLKASNVLLDADMNPKISDFGMARLFVLDEIQGNTKRIVGTYGYMAPEYAMYGQFSVKSDVFSFGVLVLEIISGQKNHCIQNGENVDNLLSYAWKSWGEGLGSNFIDPTLRANSGSVGEMMRCIHIGLLCVQENVADRPTMASVVHMLNSSSLTLSMPTKPAFFQHSSTDPEGKSHSMSINEDSFTELYPR